MNLKKLLQDFHGAVLQKDSEIVISEIKPGGKIPPAKQLAIYIDGYRIRLKGVLTADYPTLLYYLGESKFNKLAVQFIENNPSNNFNLNRYAWGFAEFIAQESCDKFAYELANLEGVISEVLIMEDSAPLEPSYFAGLSPEDFAQKKLLPRQASKLLEFEYPVNRYLTEFREEKNPSKPTKESSFVYVLRHQNNIQLHDVSNEAAALLRQLFSGRNVEESLSTVMEQNESYAEAIATNLQSWFANWTEEGFFKAN